MKGFPCRFSLKAFSKQDESQTAEAAVILFTELRHNEGH